MLARAPRRRSAGAVANARSMVYLQRAGTVLKSLAATESGFS
jgi:hypothetical protein